MRRTECLLDLDLSPHVLLERIAALDLAGCTVREYYDLDNVCSYAAGHLRDLKLDIDTRLAWGELALGCVELILATMPIDDPDFPDFYPPFTDQRTYWTRRFKRTEMSVRAGMIASCGPIDVRGDSRDPEAIADWFLGTVQGESVDSVLTELTNLWEDVDPDRIRTLRGIKNNAAVLVLMLGHDPIPVAPPRDVLLLEWIALREHLP